MEFAIVILLIVILGADALVRQYYKIKEQNYINELVAAKHIVIYTQTDEDVDAAHDIRRVIGFIVDYANPGQAPPHIEIVPYQGCAIIAADVYYIPTNLRRFFRLAHIHYY